MVLVLRGQVFDLAKNFNTGIFSDTLNVKMSTLHDGTIHWAVSVHYTFCDLDIISSFNSFNWKYCVLIWLNWNFAELLSISSRSWMFHYFFFHTYSRETIDVFPDLMKTVLLAFSWTLFKQGYQTFHYSNLAWDLPIHTRFGDLDQVSRSRVSDS